MLHPGSAIARSWITSEKTLFGMYTNLVRFQNHKLSYIDVPTAVTICCGYNDCIFGQGQFIIVLDYVVMSSQLYNNYHPPYTVKTN